MNKLNNSFTINTDDATAKQIELIASYYQRKPAELLRLLLLPSILNEYAKIQEQQHPENTPQFKKALFKPSTDQL